MVLSERWIRLDDVEAITSFAQDMSTPSNESELTERRVFIESFVKEIVVSPGQAKVRYTIPISQSTQKTPVLLGGGLYQFTVMRPYIRNWVCFLRSTGEGGFQTRRYGLAIHGVLKTKWY